jgi:hypothetical protein
MDDETIEETAAKKPAFEGFRKIDKTSKHFYKLPNEWTDIMADINNLAELKVVEYLMRHTWGFGEYDQFKHITVDEFMYGRISNGERMDKGTGLKSDRSARDGLKAAIEHGYIICDTDDKDKARVKKYYKLKMREVDTTTLEDDSLVDTTTLDGRSYHPDSQNLPPDAVDTTGRTQKETSERHFEKNTKERKNDAPEQNSTVATQEDSFSHPSTQSSLNLLPEVRRTHDLICQELYPNYHPNLTTKAIEHFTKLSSSIKTVEDIKSLVAYCRAEQPILNTSKIQPGNLVHWLDGWLRIQTPVTEPLPELAGDPVVTDEELAEDVWKFVQAYQDEEHFEEYLERVKAMGREAELSNYKMCDKMANACRRAPSSRCGIEDFFEQLRLGQIAIEMAREDYRKEL